jgi:hypothetical protein
MYVNVRPWFYLLNPTITNHLDMWFFMMKILHIQATHMLSKLGCLLLMNVFEEAGQQELSYFYTLQVCYKSQ